MQDQVESYPGVALNPSNAIQESLQGKNVNLESFHAVILQNSPLQNNVWQEDKMTRFPPCLL